MAIFLSTSSLPINRQQNEAEQKNQDKIKQKFHKIEQPKKLTNCQEAIIICTNNSSPRRSFFDFQTVLSSHLAGGYGGGYYSLLLPLSGHVGRHIVLLRLFRRVWEGQNDRQGGRGRPGEEGGFKWQNGENVSGLFAAVSSHIFVYTLPSTSRQS